MGKFSYPPRGQFKVHRFLPKAGQQSPIPSQQQHNPPPAAATWQQPDIAQMAQMRHQLRKNPPKNLGNYDAIADDAVPRARTSIRIFELTNFDPKLVLPENPLRSFVIVSVMAGGRVFLSYGQSPIVGAGIPINVFGVWPPSFGGGAVPIDEIWITPDPGGAGGGQVIVFEGMPLQVAPPGHL